MPNLHSATVSEKELVEIELSEKQKRLSWFIDKIDNIQDLESIKEFLTPDQEQAYNDKHELLLSGEFKAKETIEETLEVRENYDDYLFRSHAFGKLMTGLPKPLTSSQEETLKAYTDRNNGEGKPLTDKMLVTYGALLEKKNAKPKLSDGAKTYLEQLVREDIFGRAEIMQSKYTDKGLEVEDQSITLYSKVTGEYLEKNEERVTNEFWTGEADNVQGMIRDIKSSWEFKTFPIKDNEIKNALYEWQLDIYMELYGFKNAELVYCLVDTPSRFIQDEIRKLDYQYDLLNHEGNVREKHIPLVVEKVSNLIYSTEGIEAVCDEVECLDIKWFENFKEIPKHLRVKVFKQSYSAKRIQQGKDMIMLAREYMNNLLTDLKESKYKYN